MELNKYHILWTIEVLKNGKVKSTHFANKSHLEKSFKPTLGSKVYIITDAQFGMIKNNWRNETPELPKPFTHSILIEEGQWKQLIPLTKKQFENAIQY